MSSSQLEAVIERIEAVRSNWTEDTEISVLRDDLERLHQSFGGVESAVTESVDANGVPCDYAYVPGDTTAREILYLHGGGFSVCSALSHRHLAQWLALAASARVLVVDYRRVPEFLFPAQLVDARTAYDWMLQQGLDPGSICIAGDSAGGGLALALLCRLRDEGAQLPACAGLISAWTDLRCEGASYASDAVADPVANREMALDMGKAYVGDPGVLDDPYASPIRAEYAGLPPLMLQVGTRDIFIDDSRAVAARAGEAGVAVELHEWPGMIHQWHMYAAVLDEGRQALDQLGAFIKQHCTVGGRS